MVAVSILTRPVGRVQPEEPVLRILGFPLVSILTRPVGRVQLVRSFAEDRMGLRLFQSSPGP